MLGILGLEEQVHKRCDQLSGGQKQRVGIARALVQGPKMLLCDEPIASLDPNASRVIMDHLRSISVNLGITVVINLHQVETALKYSDRIIGVNKGKVVYNGSSDLVTAGELQRIYGNERREAGAEQGETQAG
jgi:phosphonate transport system ATP-binding protein